MELVSRPAAFTPREGEAGRPVDLFGVGVLATRAEPRLAQKTGVDRSAHRDSSPHRADVMLVDGYPGDPVELQGRTVAWLVADGSADAAVAAHGEPRRGHRGQPGRARQGRAWTG